MRPFLLSMVRKIKDEYYLNRSETIDYLTSAYKLKWCMTRWENGKIRITFELKKNKNKVKTIENEIDFDYYIKNITSKESQYDLSKLLNFKESKLDEKNYIMYLNDISIKKHLNSKYSGDHILGNQAKAELLYQNYIGLGFYKRMLEGKSSAEMKEWSDNIESKDYGKKIKDDFDNQYDMDV